MSSSRSSTRSWISSVVRATSFIAICLAVTAVVECDTIVDALAQNSGSSGLGGIVQQLQQSGQLPPSAQNILNAIQNGGSGSGTQPAVPSPQTTVTTMSPSTATSSLGVPYTPSTEISKIEEDYSKRAGLDLSQFGYDIIGNKGTIGTLQVGAVQDDYIMGQGDDVLVTLRGQENDTYDVNVDRDGNVTLPKLHPIQAAGRRFGDFRDDLSAAIKSGFVQTQAFITLNNVRQLSVSVEGEVTSPGIYAATGLSTILDVLQLAGGVKKSGSLRQIYIVRHGTPITLDLYRMLGIDHEASPNQIVQQGDRIVVPPIGATIAVVGRVLHGKIFELPPGNQAISVNYAMKYAGGLLRPGLYRYAVLRIRPDGKGEMVDISHAPAATVRRGEILFVDPAVERTIGEVTIAGAVRVPGLYGLNEAKSLRDLLRSPDSFMPDAYMLLGFIKRYDENSVQEEVVPFSPLKVLEGKENVALQSDDVVHILTLESMRAIIAQELQNGEQTTLQSGNNNNGSQSQGTQLGNGANGTANTGQTGGSSISSMLSAIGQSSGGSQGGAATGAAGNSGSGGQGATGAAGATGSAAGSGSGGDAASAAAALGADLGDAETSEFGTILSDYRVSLDGDVRYPGYYLAAPGTTLDELLAAAQGLRPDADTSTFEVTSTIFDNDHGISHTTRKNYTTPPEQYSEVILQRLDTVRFDRVFEDRETDATVYLGGEVRYPGTYEVLRGERLSSVITRAGGLTEQAYPYGAVFTRESVAQRQAVGFQREAKDLKDQMMYLVAEGGATMAAPGALASGGLDVGSATFIEGLITQLQSQTADGRLQIVADPAALAAHPDVDILLQSGDALVIPKRPSEITVVGEVENPGSFLARPDLDYSDYIDLAGGFGRSADEGQTFVIYPDGTSRLADEMSVLQFSSTTLPPGSVVVIPKELKPLDSERLMMDVFKAISDLALSAAAVAVLAKGS